MATPSNEDKIFKPFMPSLFLCASAKMAHQLKREFGVDALERAFNEIKKTTRRQKRNLEDGGDEIQRKRNLEDGGDEIQRKRNLEDGGDEIQRKRNLEDGGDEIQRKRNLEDGGDEIQRKRNLEDGADEIRRAKGILVHIPVHLRGEVMKAVHGTQREMENLKSYYEHYFSLQEADRSVQFMSCGTIDAVNTARNVIRDAKLDIGKKFELACVYCLVESAETLWSEMEKSGATASFATRREDIVSLWVEWLRERPRVTSGQSFVRSLGTLIPRSLHILRDPMAPSPRYSGIFPFLRPEERRECLALLNFTSRDDFRRCLYFLTRREEEQLLENGTLRLLSAHLQWPYQTVFLETAKRLWDCIDGDCLGNLLRIILDLSSALKDVDYPHLFKSLWITSPLHLREIVRRDPYLSKRIDSFFGKKK